MKSVTIVQGVDFNFNRKPPAGVLHAARNHETRSQGGSPVTSTGPAGKCTLPTLGGVLPEIPCVSGDANLKLFLVPRKQQLNQMLHMVLGDCPHFIGSGPDIAAIFLLAEMTGGRAAQDR